MKKKKLIGIIAGIVLVPVAACAILLNFKSVGIEEMSAFRDVAEIQSDETVYLDDEAIALAASSADDLDLRMLASAAFDQMNAARSANGLSPLRWSGNLESVADVRAAEISTSFSHTRPNGRAWYTVNSSIQGGENLAYGYESAGSAMDAWMNSPTHRENILWPEFSSVAIAIYVADDGTYYWAQEFGY